VRRSNRWPVLLAALLAMAFAPVPKPKPPKPDDAKGELKKLQGTWEYVSVSLSGAKVGVKPGEADLIKGDQLTCVGAGGQVTARWTVVVDPSKRPKAMDLKSATGLVLLCAYKLEGDTLTVAYGNQDTMKQRPTDLTPRNGVWVQVLKRKRP
jgi:uncharacterized protein (TIGR03067 family)